LFANMVMGKFLFKNALKKIIMFSSSPLL
jgi:hypothetical protein